MEICYTGYFANLSDLRVTQLPRTNNLVFKLPLKITRVADVLACSDSPFHTMDAEEQNGENLKCKISNATASSSSPSRWVHLRKSA